MKNTFKVIEWPEVQELMDKDEFDQHVLLINDQPLLKEYGTQAYLVRVSWLNDLKDAENR